MCELFDLVLVISLENVLNNKCIGLIFRLLVVFLFEQTMGKIAEAENNLLTHRLVCTLNLKDLNR